MRSARPTAAVELAITVIGSAIRLGHLWKPAEMMPKVSMPIMRFQPALPSAWDTVSMTRICVMGSASAPWNSRGPPTRYSPSRAKASATGPGRRRSSSAWSACAAMSGASAAARSTNRSVFKGSSGAAV